MKASLTKMYKKQEVYRESISIQIINLTTDHKANLVPVGEIKWNLQN